MYNYESVLNGIEDDIKDILFSYIETESYTSTEKEREAENFFMDYFSSLTYFKENKYSYGKYRIENDSLNRNVCYAFLKGIGKDTVVFVHHYDIVGVEDYKLLKDYAFSPAEWGMN